LHIFNSKYAHAQRTSQRDSRSGVAAIWVRKGHKTTNSWAAACMKDKTARQRVFGSTRHIPFIVKANLICVRIVPKMSAREHCVASHTCSSHIKYGAIFLVALAL